MPSLSSILTYFQYQPNSVGYLSECFQTYGRALPSTLSMTESKVVFYLSDEIFARHQPILVTIEAQSTAILKIQLASDRSAQTWKAHFEDLGEHRFHSIGMASDRGVGLVAGYQWACQDARWVCDRFHEFQDLFDRRRQLERKAYAAIAKEDEAAHTFHNAKSEANLHKRLQHYERAHHACEHGETPRLESLCINEVGTQPDYADRQQVVWEVLDVQIIQAQKCRHAEKDRRADCIGT